MPEIKKSIILIFLIITINSGCKEKYLPSISSPSTGYLVVEGFISSDQKPTLIKLTRSVRLIDSVNIIYERNATVTIEGEDNQVFSLYESSNGQYLSNPLNLNNSVRYRLHIKTADTKEYVSDFTPVKHTPPLDSISWQRENEGLRIYVNTHDAQNNTRYYQWKYEETWEIHSAFLSNLKYIINPANNKVTGVAFKDLNPDTTIYKCWPSTISNNINLGSSEKLSRDLIYLPLLFIEKASEKVSVRYSINVKQYALSHAAYLFFQKIKKNTEELGSIFDPQPSDLQGNIHCLTNPAEKVIGYVDISEEQELRRFIDNAEVPGWNYQSGCSLLTIANQEDSIEKYALTLAPVVPVKVIPPNNIVNFSASSSFCVDCTLRATNVRPSFWP